LVAEGDSVYREAICPSEQGVNEFGVELTASLELLPLGKVCLDLSYGRSPQDGRSSHNASWVYQSAGS